MSNDTEIRGRDPEIFIRELQERNTALVLENRKWKAIAENRGPALLAVLDALYKATAKHPLFPDDPGNVGAILAEELLEVATAGMRVLQAINDHRDECSLDLTEVKKELADCGAVVLRALGRLAA